MKYSGWPDPGELVVGTVDEITDFGVFVELDEYEDKRGLVHISEVASGWIKNVRDHVRTGQTTVCKVLDVNEGSQQVDLSIKDVNDHQRKEKIQEWKNEQKADKWMTLALGEDASDEQFGAIANELLAEFGSLYDGFEESAIHGESALEGTDLDDEEISVIVETARENVSVPYVTITGYIDLRSFDSNGVDTVRGALEAAEGNGDVGEEIELDVAYVGAPEYRIQVKAPDYKLAEAELKQSADRAQSFVEEHGGTANFHRDRRSDDE